MLLELAVAAAVCAPPVTADAAVNAQVAAAQAQVAAFNRTFAANLALFQAQTGIKVKTPPLVKACV